jgi:hypothetical protein
MYLQTRGVSVLSNAFASTGDLITDVLIGTKGSKNQGLVKVAGLPEFAFKNIHRYSGPQIFSAAVAGFYTFDPHTGVDLTNITDISLRFNIQGFPADAPQAERQFSGIFVSVGKNEFISTETLCDRIVAAFAGNKYFTATKEGASGTWTVKITENFKITPLAKQPSLTTLHLTGVVNSTTTFVKTAPIAQVGYTGKEVLEYVNGASAEEKAMKDFVLINTGTIDSAANYDVIEILFNKRSVTSPFGFAGQEPFEYMILVKTDATNKSVFYTKINALFAVDATAFVHFPGFAATTQDTGDTITPSVAANTPKNGEVVVFSAIATTTGFSTFTPYFVVNRTATTFQISLTAGGNPIPLTTNGTATFGDWGSDVAFDTLFAVPNMLSDINA